MPTIASFMTLSSDRHILMVGSVIRAYMNNLFIHKFIIYFIIIYLSIKNVYINNKPAGFEPGTVVAVKVRHPGVSNTILRDFAIMLGIARLANFVPGLQGLQLEQTLRQFAAPLKEQVGPIPWLQKSNDEYRLLHHDQHHNNRST